MSHEGRVGTHAKQSKRQKIRKKEHSDQGGRKSSSAGVNSGRFFGFSVTLLSKLESLKPNGSSSESKQPRLRESGFFFWPYSSSSSSSSFSQQLLARGS